MATTTDATTADEKETEKLLSIRLSDVIDVIPPRAAYEEGDQVVAPVVVNTARRITLRRMLEAELVALGTKLKEADKQFEAPKGQTFKQLVVKLVADPSLLGPYRALCVKISQLETERATLGRLSHLNDQIILQDVRKLCHAHGVISEFVAINSEWNVFLRANPDSLASTTRPIEALYMV